MRIHSIDAIAVDIPLTQNFGGATYSVLKRSTVITRLRTEDGLVSEVYNGDNREQGPQIVRLIRNELAPLVRGMSIRESERVFEAMFARTIPNGRRGVGVRPARLQESLMQARIQDRPLIQDSPP